MDGADLAREYYRAIDEADYGALTDALAGCFVHRRPDTTIEGREEFVSFMRSGRPETDTVHDIEGIYNVDGGGGGDTDGTEDTHATGDTDGTEDTHATGDTDETEDTHATGDTDETETADATGGGRVAVEGRLLRADGSEWFRFVDVFTVRGGRIQALRTYTH